MPNLKKGTLSSAFMANKDFFDSQTDLTASKILIYRGYLSDYLPKVLMQFGKCFIADFFCGPGKNGARDGSPLALIDVARKVAEDPYILKKWPSAEIRIVFSDADQSHCDNLAAHLKTLTLPSNLKIFGPYCEPFQSILQKAVDVFKLTSIPKFFFLDPFTYSDIGIDDIKKIMGMPAAEALLFLPTFHSYRFHKCANDVGALKTFLENFTERGCADYADLSDFNASITKKLVSYIGLQYVREIDLIDGAQKHALFYLTKHVTGMLIMNKLVWKHADDGMTIKAKKDTDTTLFDLSTITDNFASAKTALQQLVASRKRLTNVELIDGAARIGLDTKHANEILKDMKKKDLISVEYKKLDKKIGMYVSDNNWDQELATIVFKE